MPMTASVAMLFLGIIIPIWTYIIIRVKPTGGNYLDC